VKVKFDHKRTLFLGLLATAVFAWSAITHFEVAPEELLRHLLNTVLVVLFIPVLAAFAFAVFLLLRRLGRKSGLLRAPPE
jgi:ABC-type Co2+ transport system permease subunit